MSSGSILVSILNGVHQLWIRHTPEGPWHFIGVFNDVKLMSSGPEGGYDAPPTAVLKRSSHV